MANPKVLILIEKGIVADVQSTVPVDIVLLDTDARDNGEDKAVDEFSATLVTEKYINGTKQGFIEDGEK